GSEPLAGVLSTLVAQGGKVVDTWPRDGDNDAAFGQVVSEPEFAETLFVTTKIDRPGKEAGLAQFRDTQRAYRRDRLDLVQIWFGAFGRGAEHPRGTRRQSRRYLAARRR